MHENNGKPEALLWIDFETTGVDRRKSLPLEIGMECTDMLGEQKFGSLSRIIRPDRLDILSMSPVAFSMHTDNGLLFELMGGSVRNDSMVVVANAVEEFLDSLSQRFSLVPAGTNVDFDLDFLRRLNLNPDAWLTYRKYDMATIRRLVTVLGVSDEMGKLMRFRPELVMAAASDSCESHLYNHAQRRAHVLEAVGADPADNRMPKATKPLAEAATALRQTYRKQLAAIMAQDATADDPIEIQPRISQELSDLADAALEGALAIARNEVDGSEHVRFAIIGMGKLGARELNYVSDVDLIYVVEPADADTNGMTLNRVGTKMATTL